MRADLAPPGLAGLVRAHARCPPEASGCAERARAARRRTCEVSLEERAGGCAEPAAWGASTPHLEAPRPSGALRASFPGDEQPVAHPALDAAAAGRLHCLTATRAASRAADLRALHPATL
ncbi:zinc finger protein 664 isoform X2 [Saccopteryx bilineata]|uniref:zinc finger protein 664 isoform X2 n=1 Tax=Saccopteryx bilineata TaxID=59482 RepID=UPI00338E0005